MHGKKKKKSYLDSRCSDLQSEVHMLALGFLSRCSGSEDLQPLDELHHDGLCPHGEAQRLKMMMTESQISLKGQTAAGTSCQNLHNKKKERTRDRRAGTKAWYQTGFVVGHH